METRFDVVGIGNAIVDVLARTEDAFLEQKGLTKGTMTLIDAERAEALYAEMGPGVECSGGSAANTVAGIASLGGRAAYIGKVHDDLLGKVFRHDIQAIGVDFQTPSATTGPPTARCLILVSPDAQRTMATFLGASSHLSISDIDADVVASSKVTYLEGYLWDPDDAKQAFLEAARIAHEAGRKVSLTLSDPFCVDRHRDSFCELVQGHVDLLFANEEEIKSLYQVGSFEEAIPHVRGHCEVAVLTRGAEGSVVVQGDDVHRVPAAPIDNLVDTTGAGDLFAGGFLYAYTNGLDVTKCARVGAIAAAEVISHFGARPETDLAELARQEIA